MARVMYGRHSHSAYSLIEPQEPWLREDNARLIGAGAYWLHWVCFQTGTLVWC